MMELKKIQATTEISLAHALIAVAALLAFLLGWLICTLAALWGA